MGPLPGQNKPNRQKTRKAEGWRPFCGFVHTPGVVETWDLLQPALFDLKLLSDLGSHTGHTLGIEHNRIFILDLGSHSSHTRNRIQQNLHVSCLDLGSHSSHTRNQTQQNLHVSCLQTSDHTAHILGTVYNRIFMSRGV